MIEDLNEFIINNNEKIKRCVNQEQLIVNKMLCEIAEDFKKLVEMNGTDIEFQDAIKKGLDKLDSYNLSLDSVQEDEFLFEIEKLMNIVHLESSGGHLNVWRYGFDPNDSSLLNMQSIQKNEILKSFQQKMDNLMKNSKDKNKD